MFFVWYIEFMPIKAVISVVMCSNICTIPWWPSMQEQQLLTLRWRSFSECGRERVAVVFVPKGCQYLINGCLQPIGTYITQYRKLTIINAPLRLMLRMWHWPCCCLFGLSKLPICWLWITATKSLFNYRIYKTKNLWWSIEAHTLNGAVTVLLSLCLQKLPICRLCIVVTKSPFNYHTYKTKNHWRSIDAHFQIVAGTVSLYLLPIKAANTSVMLNS